MVPEKNVTKIFCDTDDDARRKTTDSDPYMLPPLKRAGDTIRYQADGVLQATIWPCHVNLSSMVSDFNRKSVVTNDRKILCFKTSKIDLDLEPEKQKYSL